MVTKTTIHLLTEQNDLRQQCRMALSDLPGVSVAEGEAIGPAQLIVTDAEQAKSLTVEQRTRCLVIDDFSEQQLFPLWKEAPELRYIVDKYWASHAGFRNILQCCIEPVGFALDGVCGRPFIAENYLLQDYTNKHEILRRVRQFVLSAGAMAEAIDMYITCLWELVMNAAFHAPREKSSGLAKNIGLARHEIPQLGVEDQIEVHYGYGKEFFFLRIMDKWGSLTFDTVRSRMMDAYQSGTNRIKTESPGAGVGLYMLYEWGAFVDYSILSQQTTAVSILMPVMRRFRDGEVQHHSILVREANVASSVQGVRR